MLTRLTRFISLYGAKLSAGFFGLLVFVASVVADLVAQKVFGLYAADIREVLVPAFVAGVAAVCVVYPFCLAALQVREHEAELRQIRGELRDSEARFRDFADAASDWYWEMDKDLRFSFLSPRVEDVTGVPVEFHLGKTREEMAGEDASLPKWQKHLDDLKNHRPFKDFRYARRGPDGRVQHMATSGKPIFGAAGNFVGYRGVATDLTRQVEAEIRARRALDLMSAAVDGLSELFVLWDKDDRLVVCNQRYRDLNKAVAGATEPGVTFEDHIRAVTAKGLYPNAVGREEEWLADRLARHNEPRGPFELARQDGQWLLVNEQRLPDGSRVTVSTDITPLKNAERSLRESEQRLRDFASIAADWFWEQDKDLRFTFVSVENEGISGVQAHDHYGKTRRETNPVGISDEELAAHEALIEAHEPFTDFRFDRARPDGTLVHLSISGIPVFDETGAFRGYRGVGRDITQMIEAEREITEQRERAESLMHAKSDFLARIGHDLSTPLNAILGFAQVMEMELLGGAPGSKYLDYARNIRTSGEILSALISDILDLSRIEAGKLDLEDEIFGIAPLMDDIGMLFRGQAEAVEVTLLVETAEEISDMRGDRKAVLQALMNLVSNAVKFTDAGGRIAVSANLDGNALCLAVADTGAGFDMAELDIVLEPFGRAQQAPGRRRAGTGLGLAIAKALAELHDGTLEIDSAPGVGTTATLVFPAKRAISGDAGRAAE
ncbi:MAG: hypothetical protein CMM61_03700 [Rhodospirillaceae bacterium]|nr:hypothetical protein [Rhodospirillaceae bacterium]